MNNQKKNVVLIQVDQLPWFGLSITGNHNVNTPHLDALVRDGGVLFDNATCQSPICAPSRVSMLAGKYVSSTKQFGFDGYCARDTVWLQDVMRREGYVNGAFGKFHVASTGIDRWAFDVAAPTCPEEEDHTRPLSGVTYQSYCKEHGIRWMTDQMHCHDPVHGQDGGERVSRYADKSLTGVEQCAVISEVPLEHSLERFTANQCIAFIDQSLQGEKPFFAWLTFDRPHYPTTLARELYETIRPDELELPPLPDAAALTGLTRWLFDVYEKGTSIFHLGDKRFRKVLATYYTLMEEIDREIGRVLQTLQSHGIMDDTLLIFTADHGDEGGFNGLFDKYRRVSSEAITRIPMIMRFPQGMIAQEVAGTIAHAGVENIDIYATICDAIGVPIPDKVEGRSLMPILRGEMSPHDTSRPVFCEDYYKRMVKKDGWKMIFDVDSDKECLLYDMNNDPNQFHNLYGDERYRKERIELKREMLAFLCKTMFEPYTDFDVERIEKGLDGQGYMPLLAYYQGFSVHFYRAGAIIQHLGHHQILVRFYDPEILLFPATGKMPELLYRKREHALPPDEVIIEKYLDRGLRDCFLKIPTVSLRAKREPIDAPLSTAQEAADLVQRLHQ